MTNDTDDQGGLKDNRICAGCIGESYLRSQVKKEGEKKVCSYCGETGKTISIGELADWIETAFEEHYRRTPMDASPLEYMMMKEGDYCWEREGQPAFYAISEAAHVEDKPAEDVRQVLENRHFDFDMAAAGEENPFGEESHYEEDSVHDVELQADWSHFQLSLKTESRVFNRVAEDILNSIFEGLDKHAMRDGRKVIVDSGPGREIAAIHRARVFQSDDKLKAALMNPVRELGPPPSAITAAGRMNSRGIAVFYGAMDAAVALDETRPPVGSRVLLGRFEIIRPLRLLDVEALRSIYVKGSIFDGAYIRQLEKAKFLTTLSHSITKAVMPDDEPLEFLVTQAIADYLATRTEPSLDGIIYASVQKGKTKRNVVLFHKSARVASLDIPEGTRISAKLHDWSDEGPVPDYWVWEETPSADAKEETDDEFPLVMFEAMPRPDSDVRDPALKLDTDSLHVHHIEQVTFKAHPFDVKRHRFEMSESKAPQPDLDLDAYK